MTTDNTQSASDTDVTRKDTPTEVGIHSNKGVQSDLDDILAKHNGELGVTWEDPDVVTPDTKQAILDWHNKQIEEAIEATEKITADIEFKAGINYATMSGEYVHRDEVAKQIEELLDRLEKEITTGRTFTNDYVISEAIEAERNKLKEST